MACLRSPARSSESCAISDSYLKLFANRQDITACIKETARLRCPGPSKVVLPFALEFPSLLLDELQSSSTEKPGLTGLPPSIEIASEYLKISVSYNVRVVIKRTGAFNLNNTTKCTVAFRPLSATQACLEDHTALTRTVTYLSTASLGVKSPTQESRLELPPYTPSVLFEVQIPPCKTIFPGEHIRLGLAFVIPDELRNLFATVWIHRVWIQLRTNTTATIGSKREVSIQHADCCKIEGNMPLSLPEGGSRIEIPSELWEHNTYPKILPSFHVAEARREHQLEIVLQFAWSFESNVHVSKITPRLNGFGLTWWIDCGESQRRFGRERRSAAC